ncbi:MAG: CoA activase [Deltaproteobacteria bacterium]|nr:CoA activase [Deltaproteobacteria bacterium]
MITAGLDIGAKTIKIVIMKDGVIIGRTLVMAGYDVRESLNRAWDEVLPKAGIGMKQIERIMATGAGKKEADRVPGQVSEVSAAAKGAIFLDNRVRTVIDVGAEEGRAIRINAEGKVVDFAINEKCAAGTGAFTEAMARALEIKLEELGPLSLQSTRAVAMNAQCAVFAESELVTLVHAKTPTPDMARAVHDAIADRVVSMVRRVGLEKEAMLIGGVAKNVGFLKSLNRELEMEVIVPEEPEFVSALGAALLAAGN